MKRVLALTVLTAISSACGLLDPRPDPSRFFVLASLQDSGTKIDPCALPANARVGLGPIDLPDYLRQPELLTRTSPTELARSQTDRWSEPLRTMLPRVLGDDLAQIFGGARVDLYPWYSTDRPDWQIAVEIVRFEPDEKGEVLLIARWNVRELAGAGRSIGKESRITHPAANADPSRGAEAMSAALGALAQELAQATCGLATPK